MSLKRSVVHRFQRLANHLGRRLPATMLETVGRKSGLPRTTAIGGRLAGDQFWMVSEHGMHSDYVKNIVANPQVRLRVNGQWRTGIAHLLPEDDTAARLRQLPSGNSAAVRVLGTDLLTIRIDLD